MANRFPVTVNSSVRRLEELPSDDNLNLSSSGIYDGVSIGVEGQQLYSTGTGIEWRDQPPEYDTLYNISAVDGTTGKKIIRLSASGSGSGNDDVTLVAGTNVTLTRSGDEITINSSYVDTNTVTRVKESTSGTFVSGDITLTANGSVFINQVGNAITIGATDTNTVTRLRATSSNPYIFNDITLLGSGAAQVSQSGNNITIDATNTVTQVRGGSSASYLTGNVTFLGSGATAVNQQGSNITFSSTDTTYGISVVNTNTTTKSLSLTGSNSSAVSIDFTAGTGISLTAVPAENEIVINTNAQLDTLTNVSAGTPSEGDVIRYDAVDSTWYSTALSYNDLADLPVFSTVATSGSYSDLSNSPVLSDVATSGSYSDLLNLPPIDSASSNYRFVATASDKSVEMISSSANYFVRVSEGGGSQVVGTLISGPITLVNAQNTGVNANITFSDETVQTTAFIPENMFSGSYNDLTDTPVLFSGSYNDLTNKPSIPPEQNYSISSVTSGNGVSISLSESVSSTSSSVKIIPASSNKISVTRNANSEIEIDSSVVGLPSGVAMTNSSIVFEGSSVNDVKTTLFISNPSVNRTITFPNDTGTVVLDGQNKTYRIDALDTSTNTYEAKLGLIGSNTGITEYLHAVGSNGLKVSSDRVGGSQAAPTINTLTISAPPSVHIGSNPPSWAKDGDLWFNPLTFELKVYDESLLPTATYVYNHFQSLESGGNRFYNNGNTPTANTLPSASQYIVASGLPNNTTVSSVTNATGSSVGSFVISQNATASIPHGAKLYFYNSNPNIDLSTIWTKINDNTASGTAPTSSNSPGSAGQIAYDSDYFYVCVGTNSWKRAPLSTW